MDKQIATGREKDRKRAIALLIALLSLFLAFAALREVSLSSTPPDPKSQTTSQIDYPSEIPESVASLAAADKAAQEKSAKLKAEEDQAQEQLELQKSQTEQAPTQFSCNVYTTRTGADGAILVIHVQAPAGIPEVWATVTSSDGTKHGKVFLQDGSGEQIVNLRRNLPNEHLSVEIYSMPSYEPQFRMCDFR